MFINQIKLHIKFSCYKVYPYTGIVIYVLQVSIKFLFFLLALPI